jgi:hypothetical protein
MTYFLKSRSRDRIIEEHHKMHCQSKRPTTIHPCLSHYAMLRTFHQRLYRCCLLLFPLSNKILDVHSLLPLVTVTSGRLPSLSTTYLLSIRNQPSCMILAAKKENAIDSIAAIINQDVKQKQKKKRQSWDEWLHLLKEYHRKHRDCNVPTRWKEDPCLGSWVLRQRQLRESLSET